MSQLCLWEPERRLFSGARPPVSPPIASVHVVLPEGTEEHNLSPKELEAYRSKSIQEAGLPCEFELEDSFYAISRIIPDDDEDLQSIEDRVWAKYRELVAEVPPFSSALFAKPDA